ncbi:MAG: hypothetical protein R2731_00180 [Nocardioides sp.]
MVTLHVLWVAAGVAALVAAVLADPRLRAGVALPDVGAVVVGSGYAWGLAARAGGRPLVFGTLALAVGVVTVVTDRDVLRSGCAVMTAAVGAVLAVMATVPAVRFVGAVREVLVALATAGIGALAAVGFEPVITLARFEYVTLAVALVIALGLVYRLGAGFHGLGRRGLVTMVGGAVFLGASLGYAELLRAYGTPGLVESAYGAVAWSREHLGAFPRPIQAVLGIPALVWGCHQRARRRQGWWASAFGVAATVPLADLMVNPGLSLAQVGLIEAYTLPVGLLVGYLVVRADLALTGPRGAGARRAEEAAALRPEPGRTHPSSDHEVGVVSREVGVGVARSGSYSTRSGGCVA